MGWRLKVTTTFDAPLFFNALFWNHWFCFRRNEYSGEDEDKSCGSSLDLIRLNCSVLVNVTDCTEVSQKPSFHPPLPRFSLNSTLLPWKSCCAIYKSVEEHVQNDSVHFISNVSNCCPPALYCQWILPTHLFGQIAAIYNPTIDHLWELFPVLNEKMHFCVFLWWPNTVCVCSTIFKD